jgi:tRNA (cmo5U34)-methyltransferase
LQELNTDLHHAFKRANGYSDLEIAQKRSALDNVLIPETLAAHRTRLQRAGFSSVDVWFQCFNFASLVAIK